MLHGVKLAETLAGSTRQARSTLLVLPFFSAPVKSIPLARHSTCDFLGSGSNPRWVTTILEGNISRHVHFDIARFLSTHFSDLKTVDERSLYRRSIFFCFGTLPNLFGDGEANLLAFSRIPFLSPPFSQLLPLPRVGNGVGKAIVISGGKVLSSLSIAILWH